jgi:hypothetical protein
MNRLMTIGAFATGAVLLLSACQPAPQGAAAARPATSSASAPAEQGAAPPMLMPGARPIAQPQPPAQVDPQELMRSAKRAQKASP